MANVFTKRSKIPRTTTLGDYGMRSGAARHFKDQHRITAEENQNRFLHSPTRRQNPQPAGLVYQSPYNRFSNVFGIWDVNPMIPAIRCEKTIPHICRTNFVCNHNSESIQTSLIPSCRAGRTRQPNIRYGKDSIQRNSYTWPDETPKKFQTLTKPTRFGHTPCSSAPAVGIAPNVISRGCRESASHDEAEHLRKLHILSQYLNWKAQYGTASMSELRKWSNYFSATSKKRRQKT